MEFDRWLGDVLAEHRRWFAKRLTANDTGATGGHQGGPYIGKRILFELFPDIDWPGQGNPFQWLDFHEPQIGARRRAKFIWYNEAKDEARITNLGGRTGGSPLQNPDNTGAIAIFVRYQDRIESWVCVDGEEEGFAVSVLGEIEPGPPTSNFSLRVLADAYGQDAPIPPAWIDEFPTIAETVVFAAGRLHLRSSSPSARLERRRACEYALFRRLELAHHEATAQEGFASFEDFLETAQTVLQRRKARSGRSLELHLKLILDEEGLVEGEHYEFQARTEGRKTPDFLFPSKAAYDNPDFDPAVLRMLAVKTTARDRWRQALEEADRIPVKHLFTLQEGMTEQQFEQVDAARLRLVIPRSNRRKFPAEIRPKLIPLEDFIEEVRNLQRNR